MVVRGDKFALDVRVLRRGPAHAALPFGARPVTRTAAGLCNRATLRLMDYRLDAERTVGACLRWELATTSAATRAVADLLAAKGLVLGYMSAVRRAARNERVFVVPAWKIHEAGWALRLGVAPAFVTTTCRKTGP